MGGEAVGVLGETTCGLRTREKEEGEKVGVARWVVVMVGRDRLESWESEVGLVCSSIEGVWRTEVGGVWRSSIDGGWRAAPGAICIRLPRT